MRKRSRVKYIHEGEYIAQVDVELLETDDEWAPYLSLRDAYKLDDVRNALRRGDLKEASRQARVFTMQPVTV